MTPEVLANVIETLMKAFTTAQKFEVLGRLVAGITMGPSVAPTATPVNQQQTPMATAPTASTPPAAQPVKPSGKVMIPKGFICECDSCKEQVYEIETDVLETMGKKDFVAAFTPMSADVPELKMPLDTWSDHAGNMAINCPLCKGEKSLWIKGKGDVPYNDVPPGMAEGAAGVTPMLPKGTPSGNAGQVIDGAGSI